MEQMIRTDTQEPRRAPAGADRGSAVQVGLAEGPGGAASLAPLLAGLGFEVQPAADVAELLAADRERPDVVLVDADAEGVDAGLLLAALAGDPRLAAVPVVLVSAAVNEAAGRLGEPPHDWLRRPFEPVELASRVRAAARASRLEDELRRLSIRIQALSLTDLLTGLGNRRHLEEHLEIAAAATRRQHQSLSVLTVDVDYLRRVNESFGRAGGDEVVRRTAARLSSMLRAQDVAGRWSGGEFLVVLPGTDLSGAWVLADRVRLGVCDEPVRMPDGSEVVVTVSIGCASGQGVDVEGQVRRAEAALAEAKGGGRNRVVADTSLDI